MNLAYLLLGSNVGEREKHLSIAINMLKKETGEIISRSHIYNTKAWGKENQDDFLNIALILKTTYKAEELLQKILIAEEKAGRIRKEKWEPRVIDIDILLFNNDIIHSTTLDIPHPHLHERKFALAPLAEIAGNIVHPILKRSINELLLSCTDALEVNQQTNNSIY